jgi:molybdopterin synthase catalytic subunit
MAIRLTDRPLEVARAYRELEEEGCGGVAIFLGRVRPDQGRAGKVVALDYEADERLARGALEHLAAECARRYGAQRIVLHHRLGRLRVGVVSVIVGAAAPHRRAAFDAARFLIERLKVEVPIWKTDRVRRARRPPRRRPARAGR